MQQAITTPADMDSNKNRAGPDTVPLGFFAFPQKFPCCKNLRCLRKGFFPCELVTLMEGFVCSLIWIHITEDIAASNFSIPAEPALL